MDGSTVCGPFSVRVDFRRPRPQTSGVAEGIEPVSFEVILDGQPSLQVALSNETWSYHIISLGGLEQGFHLFEVALIREGADIPGSPGWLAGTQEVSDRVHYVSKGPEPCPPPVPHMKVPGELLVELRRRLVARARVGEPGPDQPPEWPVRAEIREDLAVVTEWAVWHANQTAILVVDMWEHHGCAAAAARAAAMVPALNRALLAARDLGVTVIHAPSSGVDEMAPLYPAQRRRMVDAAAAGCPAPAATTTTSSASAPSSPEAAACPAWAWTHAGQSMDRDPATEPPIPIPSGCDTGGGDQPAPWDAAPHAQHPGIAVLPADGLSDSAREIVGFLRANGLRHVVLTGVHTNECLLKRPFGARGLRAAGFDVALARDLSDVLHDPHALPRRSHAWARESMMHHFEAHVAPTLSASRDLTRPAAGQGGPGEDV